MKIRDFVNLYGDADFIDSSTFQVVSQNPEVLRRQVTEWQRQGYLHRLKRGMYVLDARFRRNSVEAFFLANQMVSPSYVSLESALSFYDIIPEQAFAFTSVTTKRTRRFDNIIGTFVYRSVKTSLLFGYEPIRMGNREVLMASREKALLDYLYLCPSPPELSRDWLDELRLQNLDTLDREILKRHSFRFTRKVGQLVDMIVAECRTC
jgi:predicted transcriptional regulator of viral defense system